MTNSSTWPSPDQQYTEQGREDVRAMYLLSPSTGKVVEPGTGGLGTALAPWSSQPTQTAASAADTVLKWGTAGTTLFSHLEIQNNNTINFVYSIDADSTASGAKVYVVAPGLHLLLDRPGSTLHCHTATQVSFGGDTGITVEAFA